MGVSCRTSPIMLEQVLSDAQAACSGTSAKVFRPNIALNCVKSSCILLGCKRCSFGHAGAMRISFLATALATAMFVNIEWLEKRCIEASV